MKKRKRIWTVFFNASVILTGLKSVKGGSAKLISWSNQKKINAVISEIVLDELRRNLKKLSLPKTSLKKLSGFKISLAPPIKLVNKYRKQVLNHGDAHLLASTEKLKANFLVSLDKKHILALKGRVRKVKIVSPKELIELLS